MLKSIKWIVIFLSTVWATGLFASPQLPDYLIYGKDTIATYNLILERYLQRLDSSESNKLFGLSFRTGSSFSCWRGYQAIYKIENDSLFLADIINCGELRTGKIDKVQTINKIKSIFKERIKNEKVHINWFDGHLNFPLNNNVLRWDGVFYKIFEREKVITIYNGLIRKVEDVSNYYDDPNRLDRRDKNKVPDLLFKRLKRTKWKNKQEYDCGEKYSVTIDENGNVSKFRMLYSEKEIQAYYEPEEYNYCINKVFNAFKSLKFDILKDKGKPISEDIYIEIWIEDNWKIENWTN